MSQRKGLNYSNNYINTEEKYQCELCENQVNQYSVKTHYCLINKTVCSQCFYEIQQQKLFCPDCDENSKKILKIFKRICLKSQRKMKSAPMNCISSKNVAQMIQEGKKKNIIELSKIRIIQKNLVYVIGLCPSDAKEEVLRKLEYFGQYGVITKVVLSTNFAFNTYSPVGPSYSAYITYSNEKEASLAIFATSEIHVLDRIWRASYGTTKYCSYFLKDQQCPKTINNECLYLHSFDKKNKNIYLKEDISNNKNIFQDQQKLAFQHLLKFKQEIGLKIKTQPVVVQSILPSVESIYEKLIDYDENDDQSNSESKVAENKPIVVFKGWDMEDENEASDSKNESNQKQENQKEKQEEFNFNLPLDNLKQIKQNENQFKNDNQELFSQKQTKNQNQNQNFQTNQPYFAQTNSEILKDFTIFQNYQFNKFQDDENAEFSDIINDIQDFISLENPDSQEQKKNDLKQQNSTQYNDDQVFSYLDLKKAQSYSHYQSADEQNNKKKQKKQNQSVNNIIINHNNINLQVNNHINISNNIYNLNIVEKDIW